VAGLRHIHAQLAAPPYIIVIRFRPGTATAPATRALQRQLDKADSQFYVISPQRPDDLIDFGQVTYLPFALGVILAVLAIALISRVLVSTVLRRRQELAIAKVLGFTRSQLRWTVAWQAIALITLAMTAGIPLGITGGRWAWILLASQQGVVPEPVTPAPPILLLLPVMIAASSLIAVLPGIAAARSQPTRTLRSE
jgi:predicted lysophospholipase L1 biosynthesis ABC-type transport system permease subunit